MSTHSQPRAAGLGYFHMHLGDQRTSRVENLERAISRFGADIPGDAVGAEYDYGRTPGGVDVGNFRKFLDEYRALPP